MREEYVTLAALREKNEEAGQVFFSPDTMRMWKTRVSSKAYETHWHRFFVTSDLWGPDSVRQYTVRVMMPDGKVVTASNQYPTLKRAHTAAKDRAFFFENVGYEGTEDRIQGHRFRKPVSDICLYCGDFFPLHKWYSTTSGFLRTTRDGGPVPECPRSKK